MSDNRSMVHLLPDEVKLGGVSFGIYEREGFVARATGPMSRKFIIVHEVRAVAVGKPKDAPVFKVIDLPAPQNKWQPVPTLAFCLVDGAVALVDEDDVYVPRQRPVPA